MWDEFSKLNYLLKDYYLPTYYYFEIRTDRVISNLKKCIFLSKGYIPWITFLQNLSISWLRQYSAKKQHREIFAKVSPFFCAVAHHYLLCCSASRCYCLSSTKRNYLRGTNVKSTPCN